MKKALALFLFALPAFGAYNHVRPIPFRPVRGVSTTLSAYPVTFKGTYFYLASTSNGGGVLNASGFDIIFAGDSGCSTPLHFERTVWDSATGKSEFHIQIPSLPSTGTTTIYLCYGNAAITTDQQSSPWDANYLDVNHFPDGTTLSTADSTGNVTLTTSGSPTAGRGEIDGSALFHNAIPAPTDYLSAPSSVIATSSSKTVEAWVNAEKLQATGGTYSGIVTYGKTANVIYSLALRNIGAGVANTPVFEVQNSGGTYQNATANAAIYPGGWYHLVGVISNGANITVYVNGMPFSAAYTGAPATGDPTFNLFVGRDDYSNGDAARFFAGAVDEVRVSNIARSADWIKTEYMNEIDPASFYSVGPEIAHSSNITSVSVIGTTNTQAIVQFTYASDPSSCRLQVSENVSLSPVVHDTDTALFANADHVSRDSDNLILGRTVRAVIGKRYAAQYALDGSRYSRALQQNTPHYFQITCGSGSDTYGGSFRTTTLAMGNTHLDGLPPDSSNPGYAAWPTPVGFQRCNTTDLNCSTLGRDTQYIDPQTGVLLQHLVMPSDTTLEDYAAQATLVTGTTGWTITSGAQFSSGSLAATITGSTNTLTVGSWNNLCCGAGFSNAFGDGDVLTPGSRYNVPVMLQFNINAHLGDPACNTNNSPNCRMDVCVTLDWQTCAPNAQTYQQPLSTAATNYTIGSGQVNDVMQKPGKRIWSLSESGFRNPSVTCDGSNNVTVVWDGFTVPPDQDPAGSYFWIQPVGWQKITANTDALHFTIASACPSGGPYSAFGSSFGILVWKETNSADTLTLGPATINDLAGLDNDPQYNSGFFGAPTTVTLENGDPGGLVQLQQGSYSIDLTNGKVNSFMNTAPATGLGLASQSSSIDTSGNIWTMGTDLSLTKYFYVGDYGTPLNISTFVGATDVPLWKWNLFNNLPTCGGAATNRCFNAPTTITQPGHTLDVLLTAFDARFHAGTFNDWFFHDIENNDLIFDIHWQGNASSSYFGWVMIFDPNTNTNVNGLYGAGCVGSLSNPINGCIIAAAPGYGMIGATWLNQKEVGQMLQPGWMGIEQSVNAFSTAGGGPAVANKVSSFTTAACPTNPYSLTTCITFTVDGDPFDFLAGTGSRGVLGTYTVGDQAMLGIDDITYPNPPASPVIKTNTVNLLKLVKITGTSLTFGCVYGPSQCAPTDVNPQMLWMYSGFPAFNYPWSNGPNGEGMFDLVMWNYANDPHALNPSGNTVVWNYAQTGSHGMNGNALISTGGSQTTLCTANNGCYSNQNFQGLSDSAFAAKVLIQSYTNLTGATALSSSFSGRQGFNGGCGNDNCQVHPDYSRLGSDPVSATGIDGRPFVGIANIPAVSDVSAVTGTLYKVANATYLHPKIYDTMATTARRVLRNVSGPGSTISGSSSDYYKFCVALLVNECQSGSSVGDVYVNIPYLFLGAIPGGVAGSECYFPPSGFAGTNSANYSINDICLYDAGMEAQSYTRYKLNAFDMTGLSEQTFGHLFSSARSDIFTAIHAATNITSSTNNQYYYWPAQAWDNVFGTMLMKAPPINLDTARRTLFAPITVPIKQISGGDGAGVEFWYAEYGGRCSPNRNDACVAVTASVNASTPFSWESETYSPLSCASSCSIAVPALPEHVVYFRTVYYSGTTIVGRGPTQVIPVR